MCISEYESHVHCLHKIFN